MNEPVAWLWVHKGTTMNALLRNPMCDEYGKKHFEPKGWSSIPLYTQDQLEEARKLGMQQERALWNLSASTQEIMDTHPVKELTAEKK